MKNFKNEVGTFRLVPHDEKNKVWLPLPELVHDNAMIGETSVLDYYQLGVHIENDAHDMDPELYLEVLDYPGSQNSFLVSQRMRLKYRCDFILVYFPFDETICNFNLSLRVLGNNSMKLVRDENSVTYDGPKTLNEFQVVKFWSSSSDSQSKTSFTYSFKIDRLYGQPLMTTFFQSFLLWVLAYITLFINVDNFSDRFMGAVTALLVLAALLSSLGDHLPKTAYFKFVDLWFSWFILNIFSIILIHVLVDYFNKIRQQDDPIIQQVLPAKPNFDTFVEKKKTQPGIKINEICKIAMPTITGIFVIAYFCVNVLQ